MEKKIEKLQSLRRNQSIWLFPVCRDKSKWFAQAKKTKSEKFQNITSIDIFSYQFLQYNQFQYKLIGIDVDDVDISPLDIESGYEPGLDPAYYSDVPIPNWSVCSSNGHFQAFWKMKNPLPVDSSSKSIAYYDDVRTKLNIVLNGDFAFNKKGTCRNPFCFRAKSKVWHDDSYELSDLNLNIDLFQKVQTASKDNQYYIGNRNTSTFLSCLNFYKQEPSISYSDLLAKTIAWQTIQSCRNLGPGENAGIVRSVIRNGDKYQIRADRNYGAMGLSKADWKSMSAAERQSEIRSRQSAGAKYSSRKKSIAASERVREFFALNPTSSISEASRKLGMSRATIRKYLCSEKHS